MPDFIKTIEETRCILAEGSVIERLSRDSALSLDPFAAHAGFIYDENGKTALKRIYEQYVQAAEKYGLPLILFSPTWRANPWRLKASGLGRCTDVNGDGVRFIQSVRSAFPSHAERIFIGGLMGCSHDAYQPGQALSRGDAAEFHADQAEALARAGADFLMAATLPAFSEAAGLAEAMAGTGQPYIMSFVLRPSGKLLDNTPLWDAIAAIDQEISPEPLGYLINCVHTSVFEQAMHAMLKLSKTALSRILGLQANTSAKSPEELDHAITLESEDPETFASAMKVLHLQLGIKILGGCCGTDQRHIQALARLLST
ncbi:MAG: homocysteine S-methyltransferase family protein [Planctomycetota bacterium]